jgi:hypothetical protein
MENPEGPAPPAVGTGGQSPPAPAAPVLATAPVAVVRRPSPARTVDARIRVLGALAVLTLVGTYLAAQIDFLRRHTLGFPPVEPKRYWWPQVTHIWAPGLGAALVLALAAFVLHRRNRPD